MTWVDCPDGNSGCVRGPECQYGKSKALNLGKSTHCNDFHWKQVFNRMLSIGRRFVKIQLVALEDGLVRLPTTMQVDIFRQTKVIRLITTTWRWCMPARTSESRGMPENKSRTMNDLRRALAFGWGTGR
jgi:hypothetical protein